MTSTSPIQPPTITPHIPGRTTDRLQALLPQLFNPSMTEGEAFLRMQLSEAITVAIPLNRIEETHLLPQTQITPMPNLPNPVMGLMGTKGQVFWAIDLGQQLGLPPIKAQNQRYEVVIVRLDDHPGEALNEDSLLIGFIVAQIKGSIRLQRQALETATSPMAQMPGLRTYISHEIQQGEEQLLILDLTQFTAS